jgi:hypothetical protein
MTTRHHAVVTIVEGTLVALLATGLLAGPAFAGRTSSTVWVDQLASARSAGLPYGSAFSVGYNTSVRQPWAVVRCYANGTTQFSRTYADGSIWGETFSVYPGGPMPQAFRLTDPIAGNWTAGGADCVVELVRYSTDFSRSSVLARSSFSVLP